MNSLVIQGSKGLVLSSVSRKYIPLYMCLERMIFASREKRSFAEIEDMNKDYNAIAKCTYEMPMNKTDHVFEHCRGNCINTIKNSFTEKQKEQFLKVSFEEFQRIPLPNLI